MLGETVLHYRIDAKLGEGGMGEVYLAHDLRADRRVALKFLSRRLASRPEARLRFEREARAAAALDGANIIEIYEIAEIDGRPFFAMPYVEGESLSELIVRGPVPLERALDIVRQVALGLHRAHQAGIVHRDIKPGNVLIDSHGVVKILDFGLAITDTDTRLTVDHSVLGTTYYMSPEQARGDAVDHRSDIFSLGSVLYELLTGRPPFQGDRHASVLYAIETASPPAPSSLNPEVPREVDRIVMAMLAKDPARRPADAGVVANAFGATTRPISGPVAPRRRRRLTRLLAGAGLAVAVIAAAVWWLVSRPGDGESGPTGGRTLVAVLPFENLGVAEDEYLADGMTGEIASRLALVPDLGVISRTSTRQYKGTQKSTREIGRELGVDYLLQGTIRWSGGEPSTVRVTPELVRVADDTQLWAELFDREVTDIFAIQTEVAEHVAAALDLSLHPSTREQLAVRPTESFEAYRAFQRGMEAEGNAAYSAESMDVALAMFERAVDLDPDFALAHAMLARMHAQAYRQGFDHAPERLAMAEAAANRALDLAPDLPEARLALAYYHYWGFRDYDAALAELDAITEGGNGDSTVLAARGYILRRQGRYDEAAAALHLALDLNPLDGTLAVELANTHLGRWAHEEADRYYDLAISLTPDKPAPYSLKVRNLLLWTGDLDATGAVLDRMPVSQEIRHLYFHAFQSLCEGDHAAVVRQLEDHRDEVYETHAQSVPLALVMAWAHERLGDPAAARQAYTEARELLEAALVTSPDDFRVVMGLALACAGLGEAEKARRLGALALELNPMTADAWSSPIMRRNLLIMQARNGDTEAALQTLETLLASPNPGFSPALARVEPRLDGLREDPRFEAIVTRAGASRRNP